MSEDMKFTPWEGDSYMAKGGYLWCEFQGQRTIVEKAGMDIIAKMQDIHVDPSDVWVGSFMKSGTTWLQHIVYLILTKNFKAEKLLMSEFLFIEMDSRNKFEGDSKRKLKFYHEMKGPRLIKTHLPYHLLPNEITKGKLVYIARNLRDTTVSAYHFIKYLKESGYSGDVHTFVKKMCTDNNLYSPWWQNVLSFYDKSKTDPNILFLMYEDLHIDHTASVRKIAKFLDKTLTDAEVAQIVEETTFENSKDQDSVNKSWMKGTMFVKGGEFMRKGKVGDWQNHFTEEDIKLTDDYMNKHFKNSDLVFKYVL